jgi:chorismate mutase
LTFRSSKTASTTRSHRAKASNDVLVESAWSSVAPAAADPVVEPLYGLVDAATQRLQTADPVAASKWLSGGPITDPARVQQVLAAVSADAEKAGVPSDYVTTLFVDQINATEAIQYSRFSWWKLDPAGAPQSAPDLAASRALIDGLNQREHDAERIMVRAGDLPLGC